MPKQEAESELPGDKSCPKKTHTKLFSKSIYIYISIQKSFCALYNQCRAPGMSSAAPAYSVLGTFLSPWRNIWRRTTCQLEASHQQRKSNRKYTKISHFMGCETPSSQHLDVIQAEMLFTNFFVVQNIALSAASHDICSGTCFRKSKLRRRTIYIYIEREIYVYIYIYTHYTPNLIAMLKIILLH